MSEEVKGGVGAGCVYIHAQAQHGRVEGERREKRSEALVQLGLETV
jgi:hypothetical protein